MKKHLGWQEDDRICHLPDPAGEDCPGCCNMTNPKYPKGVWTCIWKKDHTDRHTDIWCAEWDDSGNYIDVTHDDPSYDRCKYCGDPILDEGNTYCGKACSALDD